MCRFPDFRNPYKQVSMKTIQEVSNYKSVLSLVIISWATSEMHTVYVPVLMLRAWCEKLLRCQYKLAKKKKDTISILIVNPLPALFWNLGDNHPGRTPTLSDLPASYWGRKAVLNQILRPLPFSGETHLHVIDVVMCPVLVASQPGASPNCGFTLSIIKP